MNNDDTKIVSFLHTLRKRIILIFIAIFFGTLICYVFRYKIWQFIENPYSHIKGKDNLIFITPTEALYTNLKIFILGGIIFSSPFIFYQTVSLIPDVKKKVILWTSFFAFCLFITGIFFSYYLVLPFTLKFFLKFEGNFLQAQWTVSRYLSFFLWMLFSFGFIFELPVIVYLLTKFNIVHTDILKGKRKYALLVIFIIAGFLSPGPDIISQILIAVPLIVLYEISIWITYFV